MKYHRAPQFDLPGTEYVFNLSGQPIAPESNPAPAMPAQDWTGELFPTSEPMNKETKNKKP